jgi:hypothetical protein
MNSLRSIIAYGFAAALVSLGSAPVLACTACFGQSDSNLARGMNLGIFALLLVITSVLCGIASFFVFVARRTARTEEATQHLGKEISRNQSNA